MVPLPLSTIKTHFHPTSMFLFSSPSLCLYPIPLSHLDLRRNPRPLSRPKFAHLSISLFLSHFRFVCVCAMAMA